MTSTTAPPERDLPWSYTTTPEEAKAQNEQMFAGLKLPADPGWPALPAPGAWEPPAVVEVARRACVLSIIAAVGFHEQTQQELAEAVEQFDIAGWMTPPEQAMYLEPTGRATVNYAAMPDQIQALLYVIGAVDLDLQTACPDDLIDLTPAGGKVTAEELIRGATRRPLDEVLAQLDMHLRFMRIEQQMRADEYPPPPGESDGMEAMNAWMTETSKASRAHVKRFNRAKVFGGREKTGHPLIATYRAQAWAWAIGQCPGWGEWDLDPLVPFERGA